MNVTKEGVKIMLKLFLEKKETSSLIGKWYYLLDNNDLIIDNAKISSFYR